SASHPLRLGIVPWRELRRCRVALPRDLDLERLGGEPGGVDRCLGVDVAHTERGADAVPVGARGDRADALSGPPDRLPAEAHPCVVAGRADLQEPAPGRAGVALSHERFSPDEAALLLPRDGEAEAGRHRGILLADVVAPVAVALLHAER